MSQDQRLQQVLSVLREKVSQFDTNKERSKEQIKNNIKELRDHTENEFRAIKEENTLICYGLSACLDGLIQQGCNHTVPLAKDKLDKHLNIKAHE